MLFVAVCNYSRIFDVVWLQCCLIPRCEMAAGIQWRKSDGRRLTFLLVLVVLVVCIGGFCFSARRFSYNSGT